MKILYSEDDPTIAMIVCMTLENAGHNIQHCTNGLDLIRIIREDTFYPDLILTDFHMPGMNADMMVAELREIPGMETPIIVMSGSLMEVTALETMDIIGAIDKLADLEKLPHAIKEIMVKAGKAWT